VDLLEQPEAVSLHAAIHKWLAKLLENNEINVQPFVKTSMGVFLDALRAIGNFDTV
jgi:predicted ATP-dependent endonuclease of OLD family